MQCISIDGTLQLISEEQITEFDNILR